MSECASGAATGAVEGSQDVLYRDAVRHGHVPGVVVNFCYVFVLFNADIVRSPRC